MDDLELAKELRRIAEKEENFYTIHILNSAAKRLEDFGKKRGNSNENDRTS